VFVTPEHNTPERVSAAFERHHLLFLRQWADENVNRAAMLARETRDPGRRRAALALILPAYARINQTQAETWRRELAASLQSARTSDDLAFLAALARADFALGHADDGEQVTKAAMKLGQQFLSSRNWDLPVSMAPGAAELHDLAITYGEFRRNDLTQFVRQRKNLEPQLRLFLLAGAARGAMRTRPGHQEPD
jgi:hypothetical protein